MDRGGRGPGLPHTLLTRRPGEGRGRGAKAGERVAREGRGLEASGEGRCEVVGCWQLLQRLGTDERLPGSEVGREEGLEVFMVATSWDSSGLLFFCSEHL